MILPRQTLKDTSYAYRYHGLSTSDLKRLTKLKKTIIYLSFCFHKCDDDQIRLQLDERIRMVTMKYCELNYRVYPSKKTRRNRVIQSARTIESFSQNACWKRFRTRKEDLPRLLKCFRLDLPAGEYFRSHDKAQVKFTGEEILLIGLHRYIVPGQLEHTMGEIFSMDYSMLSRAITIFNNHMLTCHEHLLTDNLEYWKPWFPHFAESISKKLADVGNIHYPPNTFRVAMFHDDTVIASCRPGSGPLKNGGRKSNFIQMAFYNGWKKHHGFKFQTVELPNGMCMDMTRPFSFRRNDLEVLAKSKLNERLAQVQSGDPVQYCSYGDGIFPIDSHTIGKHVGDPTDLQRYENRMMSKIRIANEWAYGVTANLFPYVKYRAAQKLLLNKLTTKFYTVATLLRNSHMCLYEGLASNYFDCDTPSLENYFLSE